MLAQAAAGGEVSPTLFPAESVTASPLITLSPPAAPQAPKLIYTFPIREDIMPAVWRMTRERLKEAQEMGADAVLIDMNTYGGLVDVADSIRTAILNYPIPVWVFVNNQAASAGALIAISADSIYMRQGGSIGAASVVNQTGEVMPEKLQSFMRGVMRATAQAHGKVPEEVNGDTVWRWHRDPAIAEAMVGVLTGSSGADSVRVLTLTADEARARHYSEGTASSVAEVIAAAGITDYEIYEYEPSFMDRLLGFLMHPALQGIFIMLIIGGIYFELQTPGVGFPLVAAILGAVLYFAPLYVEGIAENWELVLFIVGLILIGIEIFVTPGFGVLGILGIIAVVTGLAFAAIDRELFRYIPTGELSIGVVLIPIATVIISFTAALVAAFWLGKRFLTGSSHFREKIVLTTNMDNDAGYVSFPKTDPAIVGKTGTVTSTLRPSGKIIVDGQYYEAVAEEGFFIDKGNTVTITRLEGGVVYCKKA